MNNKNIIINANNYLSRLDLEDKIKNLIDDGDNVNMIRIVGDKEWLESKLALNNKAKIYGVRVFYNEEKKKK